MSTSVEDREQPYPAAPPPSVAGTGRRRRSRWLTIGLPLLGVLLLGGCGARVLLFVGAARSALGPAQHAADAYAAALVEQRWDDAHTLLCARDQLTTTAADLAARYDRPRVTGYHLEGLRVTTTNGRESASATLALTRADGLGDHVSLPLSRDGGSWRPCP